MIAQILDYRFVFHSCIRGNFADLLIRHACNAFPILWQGCLRKLRAGKQKALGNSVIGIDLDDFPKQCSCLHKLLFLVEIEGRFKLIVGFPLEGNDRSRITIKAFVDAYGYFFPFDQDLAQIATVVLIGMAEHRKAAFTDDEAGTVMLGQTLHARSCIDRVGDDIGRHALIIAYDAHSEWTCMQANPNLDGFAVYSQPLLIVLVNALEGIDGGNKGMLGLLQKQGHDAIAEILTDKNPCFGE